MNVGKEHRQRFLDWVKHPQVLVGLSAVLLSVCGLGVSIYEAHLMRVAQRASVWPYLEVSASVTDDHATLWVQNTGVGPARVRAAAVALRGRRLATWSEVLDSVLPARRPRIGYYTSLINGRVLPSSSSREPIFSVEAGDGETARAAVDALRKTILERPPSQSLDVTVCYCSVYEECWISDLQEVLGRAPHGSEHRVGSCDAMPRSAI